MNWQLWTVFGLFFINALFQPILIGKPRKTATPRGAAGIAVLNLAFAGLVLWGAA